MESLGFAFRGFHVGMGRTRHCVSHSSWSKSRLGLPWHASGVQIAFLERSFKFWECTANPDLQVSPYSLLWSDRHRHNWQLRRPNDLPPAQCSWCCTATCEVMDCRFMPGLPCSVPCRHRQVSGTMSWPSYLATGSHGPTSEMAPSPTSRGSPWAL